jgi:DNA processing protein
LWVRGEHRLDELAAARSVAVVGSRAATEYSNDIAAELAYTLASKNITVWSSAAYGIDGAAHRGALATERPASTVAVVAYGVDVGYPAGHVGYPAGHVGLLQRIVRFGAVVSEYPPGVPPARHRFLARNRLLSAFTRATVVVEAGPRSGARDVARTVAALGRPVLAVPGPITSAQSTGAHQLVQDGTARLVTSADDIVAVLEQGGETDGEPETAAAGCEADRG